MNRALAPRRSDRPVVVVDLGGTWVRVAASRPAGRAYRGRTPGVAGLPALLARLWRRWGLARRDLAALGVASRGIWTAGERRALARRLRRFARRVVVISDVEAAYLSALGDAAGVLLLAGTGSIALGRDRRGRFTRAGGLGPLLGDDGSAFALGRAWLRADSVAPARVRRLVTAPDAVARVAALAPAVLRRARGGHRAARRIVADAQRALADLVVRAAPRIGPGRRIPVSWAGGLLGDPRFRAGVWRELRRRGLPVAPTPPAAAAATPEAWRSVL
ncbi:MAG TPA: BadF/BadG/BcrA/BcrD ATPase family protein [Verrucomicrobiae bacterium]|jgi:N-acetylmuramic acid 6-phosphate etherase|nr:BadF/BadG/BcrA/BcrD ATPase family protein [Verrucomicrobiae bacterium]